MSDCGRISCHVKCYLNFMYNPNRNYFWDGDHRAAIVAAFYLTDWILSFSSVISETIVLV